MATLRAIAPKETKKRLKMMVYGPAGVGKTTAVIQFPKPYIIDCERGTENREYVKLMEQAGGNVFRTADFDEVLAEVTTLLSVKHDFQTLVIDPFTVLYSQLLDKCAKSLVTAQDAEGTSFGRHIGKADRYVRRLYNLMLRLDMNVVVVCQAKDVYGEGMKKEGVTFDGHKKLDYLFDLVFEISKRGKERVATVRKTRLSEFEDGTSFPWSYASVRERYGADVLESECKPEALASSEQVSEMVRLIDVLKVDQDTTDKWLDKAGAQTWAEMPAAAAQKCIDWMKARVTGDSK